MAGESSSAGYTSVAERLVETNNRPAGFDYMRLILSLSVISFHTTVVGYGPAAQEQLLLGPGRPIILLILPMFFALSGFLVASSLERSKTIFTFLGLRALRIVPALSVDTIFSALILGPIFTELPLDRYFHDDQLARYFLNIIGDIHFYLPGVFGHNPVTYVNQQLWTIPSELKCYAYLAILGLLQIHRRRYLFLLVVIVYLAREVCKYYTVIDFPTDGAAPFLIPSFLMGVCAYLFRDRLHYDKRWLIAAIVASGILLNFKTGVSILSVIPVTYLTVYLGLTNPKKIGLVNRGDYSYGLYLYGLPIQQALVALSPAAKIWYVNLLCSVPLCFLFAMGSWHFFEKPSLACRKYLYIGESWFSSKLRRLPASVLFKLADQRPARNDR